MKKLNPIVSMIVVGAVIALTSCGYRSHTCPTYMKIDKSKTSTFAKR